jgi:4-alpha-glucanotransferase
MTAARLRRAGLVVPLFSCASSRSWGIGEIPDLVPFATWMASAGLRALQVLPVNEMPPGEQSPYGSMSAMAIDPLYLHLVDIEDFAALGGEAWLDGADRRTLDALRRAGRVEYQAVREIKNRALAAAFDRFVDAEWKTGGGRADELRRFIDREAWWLDEYALFRAIHAEEDDRPWTTWSGALGRREPAAIDEARRRLQSEMLFRQYLQWQATRQWTDARAAARGVALLGDLPFMVSGDSADVWARQSEFRLDLSLGVPPDAFSASGQNWGLPVYRWDVVADGGFTWLRDRGRRGADLYNGFRIDHLVGFYRTYGWPLGGGEAFFTPAAEDAQLVLGERVMGVFLESGAEIFAEDLGTVPDFVRASLARLGVAGFRVLRWEREWKQPGAPFRNPADYPERSVATSGTHDTETLAQWWDEAPPDERAALADVVSEATGRRLPIQPFGPAVRDALLETLYAAGSNLLLFPVQDVFGWRDRINTPATIASANWTFRLPWMVDRLDHVPEAIERRGTLKAWAVKHRRA